MELLGADVRVSLNLSNREFWSPRLLDHLDLVLSKVACCLSVWLLR